MMKKVLTLVAMAAFATAGFAQSVAKAQNLTNAKALNAKALNAPIHAASKEATPKTTRGNGVFYERPEGLWYSSYMFGEAGDMAALHCPALTELLFVNGCKANVQSSWSLNNSPLDDYTDEDNNLVWVWSGCDDLEYGYNAYYAPVLTSGRTTFQIAPIHMVANDVMPVQADNPVAAGMYTGFKDGPAWGTGGVINNSIESQTGGEVIGYRRDFEKPISPMTVTSISFPATSKNADPLAGNVLVMRIYELNEQGRITGDPKETLFCSSVDAEANANVGYYIPEVTFSKTTINEFGDEEAAPFVIDYPFAVTLTGWDEEGVNINFFLLCPDEDEFEFEASSPTYVMTSVVEEGEEVVYNYYFKGESDGEKYCYAMPIQFNALYDKLIVETQALTQDDKLIDGANYVEVSADGTSCQNYVYSDVQGGLVTTACPWYVDGDENYSCSELPEWILTIAAEPFAEEQDPLFYQVSFTAEALPENVAGRGAYVYLEGRGVVADEPFFVYQGDLEAALNGDENGINSVSASKNYSNNIYNLLGQKVSAQTKGIVVKNGKKFINK